MRYPIQVAMMDDSGESMTEVGYMGDPMRITASASGADIENPETHFIPGSGLAKLGNMVFNAPGNFNLKIELTYKVGCFGSIFHFFIFKVSFFSKIFLFL